MSKLHIDCSYGVSGDMLNGALIDIGASQAKLLRKLDSLNLKGCHVKIEKVESKNATDFDVVLDTDNHDHDMKYLYGNQQNRMQEFKEKRNLAGITKLLNENCVLSEADKKLALEIFDIIATAEAKAHGEKKEEVVFHESGAMDSIVDIVSFAVLLNDLAPEKVFATNLCEGHGFINTRKGKLPIPTPAVKNIVLDKNLTLKDIDLPYELITPTGLACLSAVADFKEEEYREVLKTGYGSGKRDYGTPGTLKMEIVR